MTVVLDPSVSAADDGDTGDSLHPADHRGRPRGAATRIAAARTNAARLREMPPFGEPDAHYPPVPRPATLPGSRQPAEDDPLGLFLPPDPPS